MPQQVQGVVFLIIGVDRIETGIDQARYFFVTDHGQLIQVETIDLSGKMGDLMDLVDDFFLCLEVLVELAQLFLKVDDQLCLTALFFARYVDVYGVMNFFRSRVILRIVRRLGIISID